MAPSQGGAIHNFRDCAVAVQWNGDSYETVFVHTTEKAETEALTEASTSAPPKQSLRMAGPRTPKIYIV